MINALELCRHRLCTIDASLPVDAAVEVFFAALHADIAQTDLVGEAALEDALVDAWIAARGGTEDPEQLLGLDVASLARQCLAEAQDATQARNLAIEQITDAVNRVLGGYRTSDGYYNAKWAAIEAVTGEIERMTPMAA